MTWDSQLLRPKLLACFDVALTIAKFKFKTQAGSPESGFALTVTHAFAHLFVTSLGSPCASRCDGDQAVLRAPEV